MNWPEKFIDKVVCGDCLELSKQIPDKAVDFVLTDPPYMISNEVIITRGRNKMKFKGKDISHHFGDWDKFESLDEFMQWTFSWIDEIVRVLRDGGMFCSYFDRDKVNFISRYLQDKYQFKTKGYYADCKSNPVPQARKVKWMNGWEVIGMWQKPGGKLTYNYQLGQAKDWGIRPIVGHTTKEDGERCLDGETLVLTENGLEPIKDIRVGTLALTHEGRFKEVINKFAVTRSDIIELEIAGCGKRIICSSDHKFLVLERIRHSQRVNHTDRRKFYFEERIEWKKAKDLRDYHSNSSSHCKISQFLLYPKLNTSLQIDKELAWFYGLYLAQGAITAYNKVIALYLNKDKTDVIEKLEHVVRYLFDKRIRIYRDKRSNGVMAYFCNKRLAYELKGMFRYSAKTKSLPVGFLNLDKESAINLAMGYLDGDGCKISGRNYYQAKSASYSLLWMFKLLLLKHDIIVNISQEENSASKIYGREICGNYHSAFFYFSQSKFSQRKHHITKNFVGFKIVAKTTKEERRELYDLQIEDDYSFLTIGGISHNCHPTQKPISIGKKFISYWSNPNDLFLDCFCGSGAFLVAAKALGRRFIGIDKESKYVQITKQRLQNTVIEMFV